MKNLLFILTFVAFVGLPTYGQSKKELNAQIESLQDQLKQSRQYNDALRAENKALRKRIESIRGYIIEATANLPAMTLQHNAAEPVDISRSSSSTSSATGEASAPSSSYSGSTNSSYSGSSYSGASGRTIYTGPRGGRYYINSKGNKVYLKRK